MCYVVVLCICIYIYVNTIIYIGIYNGMKHVSMEILWEYRIQNQLNTITVCVSENGGIHPPATAIIIGKMMIHQWIYCRVPISKTNAYVNISQWLQMWLLNKVRENQTHAHLNYFELEHLRNLRNKDNANLRKNHDCCLQSDTLTNKINAGTCHPT